MSLGSLFVRSNELCAQEACILLLQQPLLFSTRSVVFVNTSPPEEPALLLNPMEDLESLPDGCMDIYMDNFHIRCVHRPANLKDVCLAEWMSQFLMVYKKEKPFKDESEDPFMKGDSQFDDDSDTDLKASSFRLTNGQMARKIVNSNQFGIRRFVNFSEQSSPEKYYREQLMLSVLYVCKKESEILGKFALYRDRYLFLTKTIERNKRKLCFRQKDVEEALNSAQENPEVSEVTSVSRIAPNLQSLDDNDLAEGSRNVANLIDENFKLQKVPCFDSDEDYWERVALLNTKQMFFLKLCTGNHSNSSISKTF